MSNHQTLTDAQLDVLHRAIDGTTNYYVEWEMRKAIRAAVAELRRFQAIVAKLPGGSHDPD